MLDVVVALAYRHDGLVDGQLQRMPCHPLHVAHPWHHVKRAVDGEGHYGQLNVVSKHEGTTPEHSHVTRERACALGEHHERQRRLAELEQAPKGDEGGHGKAHGADEAEHGKTEDGRREQGAAQDDVAGIERRPLLGAGGAGVAATGEGCLLVSGKGCGRVGGLRSLGSLHQRVLVGGQNAGAGHVGVRRLLREDAADLRHHGHGAHPAAEGAGEQQDEGERDDDRDDRAGEQGLRGDHRRERAQGAQKRDVLPADGRQRAHAHMGGKAHADDADDGEGNDGAESLGIHEGTSFTAQGDRR